MKASCISMACMYRVMMMTCFLRYSPKDFPAQHPLDFHDIKGDAVQEVFKCGPNPDAMPLKQLKAGCTCCITHPLQ